VVKVRRSMICMRLLTWRFSNTCQITGTSADDDETASHALAMRLQQEDMVRAAAGATGAAGSSAFSSTSPWPAHVTWDEKQHGAGAKDCGNFNVCHNNKKPNSFFSCRQDSETTAHGILPIPYPGISCCCSMLQCF